MGTKSDEQSHTKHDEEPALPHGGYLAEKAQQKEERPTVTIAEPEAPVPDPTKEKLPLGQQVVNVAHSIVEHLGQEAAAVSSTLKDEADDLRGIHPLHTTSTEGEAAAGKPAQSTPAGEEGVAPHMSVADQLKNAVHSTLDHLAQESEAVSDTVKQELLEFQHPHTVGRAA